MTIKKDPKVSAPKGKNFSVYIGVNLLARLDAESVKQERSRSWIMAHAVRQYLDARAEAK